jgi:hypothetical protein
MNRHVALYDFAASAGALEGYVYHKGDAGQLDMTALPVWVDNLCAAHAGLPAEIRADIQPGCDRTLGRAVKSLVPLLGEDHPVVRRLSTLIRGPLPESADAFDKKKWFQENRGPEAAR